MSIEVILAARCLRLLATEHIYRENKPDVFANNRISSVLDTLKPSAEIIAEYVLVESRSRPSLTHIS